MESPPSEHLETAGRVESDAIEDPPNPAASLPEPIIRQFVEHWGMMARSWGINPTMGELFALLYITGTDWTADDLKEHLRVSRGNVSMNLRELMAWGVVHKLHKQGERREYFRAETDVWRLFQRILAERKRRELDPTVDVLRRLSDQVELEPGGFEVRVRLASLQGFFGLVQTIATRLDQFDSTELEELQAILSSPAFPPRHVASEVDSAADCG